LRFFQGRSWCEVTHALDAREEAAQKRVTQPVERLRSYFARRGICVSTTLIVSLIAANAVSAASPALAPSITA
jgi:hypothetical protein